MTATLFYHPFSCAAGVVWMLEEVGAPYELRYVDLAAGEQKGPDILKLNPMGKLPILVDGETVITDHNLKMHGQVAAPLGSDLYTLHIFSGRVLFDHNV